MRDGYTHGYGNCRDCFPNGGDVRAISDWRLTNIPTYSGASDPEILVLGFSKGANQSKVAIRGEDFDKIAFAGARDRLAQVLGTLGLMPRDRGIDALMTAAEPRFGVASLVRCSLCQQQGDNCLTSGSVVPNAFNTPDVHAIIQRCTAKYLGQLPAKTRLVVLLGTSDNYIKKTTQRFAQLYRDFRAINPVSFSAGGATWLYATHPSPGNGHFKAWIEKGPENGSGQKRLLAQTAIKPLGL